MPHKKTVRELTSRYCKNLDDQVVLMHTDDRHGFPQSTCLSSHLCHGDDRARCEHGGHEKDKERNTTTM